MIPIALASTTLPSAAAESLAKTILNLRLAACVQISSPHQSLYFWEGKLETGSECTLLFKTRPSLLAKLEATVRQHHPYELPEWIVFSASASTDYSSWVEASTVAAE